MSSGTALILPYVAASCGALVGGYLGDRSRIAQRVSLGAGLFTRPAAVTSVLLLMSLALFLNAVMANAMVVVLFDLYPAEVPGIAMGAYIGRFGGLGGWSGRSS